MKLPVSWLKEYIGEIEDLHGFCEAMTMSGSKVEKVHLLGHDITNVVVGRIEEILPHPDADKLVVTRINIGEPVLKQIVTGATNLTVGDYIPVALHGAQLAGDLKIKKGKIRGEVSDGMLVSVEELGFTQSDFPESPEHGIYVFSEPQELGGDARKVLGILDEVIEFEITNNRPDCFSVMGLVREARATLDMPSKPLDIPTATSGILDKIDVEIANPDLCPRYIAAVVENVRIEPSPQWLRTRLLAAGLRPVNNIVDITNYVMLELGQPMHAFDIGTIEGGKIIVRTAKNGEKIATLDGDEYTLDETMLVIADSKKAVGIAGIKGGEHSKILDNTTTILFESANFNGVNIRQTSKKLGLRTDSSGKYEKGLDPTLAQKCIDRALQLVQELNCGDVVPGLKDVYPTPRTATRLDFDPQRIATHLGIDIDLAGITKLLARLGIEVEGTTAIIPTFRSDLTIWHDLAEEVARLYGYDNIPTVVASSSNVGVKNADQIIEDALINCMVSGGYSQALTYAFESPKVFDKLLIPSNSPLRNVVRISNPLGEDTSIMRTSTLNSVLTALSTNYNRRNKTARLFELVKCYTPSAPRAGACADAQELPVEEQIMYFGGYGDMDFYDIKGTLEGILETFDIKGTFAPASADEKPFMHPGQTAAFSLEDGTPFAFCGTAHPTVAQNYEIDVPVYFAQINFDALLVQATLNRNYKTLPKFPAINRDIAVVVKNSITHGELLTVIEKAGGKLLRKVALFDIYEGANLPDGHKSMAYNLTLRADDRTLTDEDATKAITKILTALEKDFDAKLRG